MQEEVRKAEIRANMPTKQRLQYAIWNARPNEVHTIIESGADVNMRRFNGGTAGQFAADNGDGDSDLRLLERGADIDRPDRMGGSVRKAVAEAPAETDRRQAVSLAGLCAIIADTADE